MANKIKVVRNITYKAYAIEANEEITPNKHVGTYFTKSDCHYYCEKDCLDALKNNDKHNKFVIYQISTIEDTEIEDKLIEIIERDEDVIKIY